MRKIISGLFISLDGVVERPDQWHFPYFTDEMGQAVDSLAQRADTALYGRQTFVEFASYWPEHADDHDFGAKINSMRKYVVSNTLTPDEVTWENSSLISGDVRSQILALKEGEGKDISMTGSGTLVRWLLEEGLLDELHLLIHPIAVVNGKRLFEPGGSQIPLQLLEARTFGSGVIHATYGRASESTATSDEIAEAPEGVGAAG